MSIISITQFNHTVNPLFDFIRKKDGGGSSVAIPCNRCKLVAILKSIFATANCYQKARKMALYRAFLALIVPKRGGLAVVAIILRFSRYFFIPYI